MTLASAPRVAAPTVTTESDLLVPAGFVSRGLLYALSHDGTDPVVDSDDIIKIADWTENPFSGSGNRTIEFWARSDGYSGSEGALHATGSNSGRGMWSAKMLDGGTLELEHWGNDNTWSGVFTDDTWVHVAIAYNNADGWKRYLWLDSVRQADSTVNEGALNTTKDDILLFGDLPVYGGSRRWAGAIFDLRIWDDVRTNQEIEDNYKATLVGDEAGLVAYFPMQEGSGNPVDLTGNTTASIDNTNARISWQQVADPRL